MRAALKAAALKKRAAIEYATTEANTIATGILTAPEWYLTATGGGVVTARLATELEGGDGATIYAVNPSRDATPSGYWSRQHYVVAPTGATQLVLTGEFRRIVGDSSSEKFALAFANQGQTAWVGSQQLVTLTDSWQTVSLTVSVTAGTVYRATLICHDAFLAVLNSRCLMRNLRVYPNGASGVFASSWYRLRTVRGDTRGGDNNASLGRPTHNPQAWIGARTKAASWVAEVSSSLYSTYATQSHGSQNINTTHTVLTLAANDTPKQFAGSGVSERKDLRIHAGLAVDSAGVKASSVLALYLPQSAGVPKVIPAKARKVFVIGDSIAAGWTTTLPQRDSWGAILRDSYNVELCLEAWGSRELADDEVLAATSSYASTGFAQVAARAAAFGATDIILALGVNDWLNATLTKTAYGTKLASYASALHSANPSAAIWALTPLSLGASYSAPNVNGDTLADFRTQATSALTGSPSVTVLDGATIFPGSGAELNADAIHPNDAGHETIADNIAAEIGL